MSKPKDGAGKPGAGGAPTPVVTPVTPVKKKRAYPFQATVEAGTAKKTVDVIFIGPTGFIARLGKQFVNVGDFYQAVFELPLLNEFINTPVRVLKTYDKAADAKGIGVDRMAEFHFTKLSDEHKSRVAAFVAKANVTAKSK